MREKQTVYCIFGLVGKPNSFDSYDELVRICATLEGASKWIEKHKDDPIDEYFSDDGPQYSKLWIHPMWVEDE